MLNFKKRMKRFYQFLLKLRPYIKYIVYKYVFIIYVRMKWNLRKNGYRNIRIIEKHITNSSVIIVKLDDGVNEYICKIPTSKSAEIRCNKNYQAIKDINKDNLNWVVPSTSFKIKIRPMPIYIESLIEGNNGINIKYENKDSLILDAKKVLSEFKQEMKVKRNIISINLFIEKRLGIINEFLNKTNQIDSIEFATQSEDIFTDVSHGDFWLGNILYDYKGTVNGIIDWDRYCHDAPSFYDEFHLDISYYSIKNSCSIGEGIIEFIKKEEVDPINLYIYWLYFVWSSFNSNSKFSKNGRWLNRNVYNVNDYFKKYYRFIEMSVRYEMY